MTAAPAEPADPPAAARKGARPLVRELPLLLLVALVIAIVIKTFVVQAFVIPSGSMQDTLNVGDKILVSKLLYHVRAIQPGDVVVFDGTGSWDPAQPAAVPAPGLVTRIYDDTLRKAFDAVGSLFGSPLNETDYVKRVIGVPGDHVVCCTAQGQITVNGVALDERSYLYPGNQSTSAPPGEPSRFTITVPPGYLWVLGDHRAISDDSRGHQADPGNGMVPENKVIGRAFVIAWPPGRWRILPIPATFGRPGIVRAGSVAGAASLPAAAGVVAAVPLVSHRRRRRGNARPDRRALPEQYRGNAAASTFLTRCRHGGRIGSALMNDEQASPDWLTDNLGAPGGLAEPVAAATARQRPPEPEEPRGEPAGAHGPSEGQRDASEPDAPSGRKQRRRWSAWQELPILIVVALAIALVIKSFVVQPFFIPSSSMEDTLLIGDKVLVNKLVYDFRGIDRGDIIVFNGVGSWNPAPASHPSSDPIVRVYDVTLRPLFSSIAGLFGTPADQGTDYVKRVIGLPGDHVACCNAQGLMTVNGVPLHESSYVYPGSAPSEIHFSITVPKGRLWVMGDNRSVSDDSRMRTNDPGGGTIPENEVIGRAFVIVWPPSRWRTLPIPATFDQPALVKAAAAAAPYTPLVAGVGAAVPLTWLQLRVRRGVGRGVRRRLARKRR